MSYPWSIMVCMTPTRDIRDTITACLVRQHGWLVWRGQGFGGGI